MCYVASNMGMHGYCNYSHQHSAFGMTKKLTWMVSQGGKGPQHIFNALGGEVRQLVHQLPLQHLEQHGTRVVVQRGKSPQSVAHVLAVELGQTLHGLGGHGAQHLSATAGNLHMHLAARNCHSISTFDTQPQGVHSQYHSLLSMQHQNTLAHSKQPGNAVFMTSLRSDTLLDACHDWAGRQSNEHSK